ncbi:lamin tail domain-containing protein [soil metagenome]
MFPSRRLGAACFAALALGLLHPATPHGASPTIVISQVYGGGGNAGAAFRNDFIELFNRSSAPVSVEGWRVQYASSAGTSWAVTILTGSIPAGGYYLVQESQGAGGTINLPSPDAAGTIAMSGTSGKVALVSTTTALIGSCPSGGNLVDIIGFGAASCSETAPTAALSNTTAALRQAAGCLDTDSNNTDFVVVAPAPRNSATAASVCDGPPPPPTLSVNDVSITEGNSGPVTATVTVSLNAIAPAGGVTFDIATLDDSATAASGDYIARSLTGETIPAGQQTYSFDVTISGDTAIEANETFFVDVTSVAGAAVGDGRGSVTITNDDFAATPSDVVISQVYGGGGNSGATYTNDFIELFNRGTTAVDLTGWSVQYASATGASWQATPLAGTIAPGRYYLVQQAAGSAGSAALPAPDAAGTVALAAGAGKVALGNTASPFSGACPSGALVDFVGYGATASCFEGVAPTSTLSATLAALRKRGGCFDSNDNASDFLARTVAPRNSAAPARSCDFLTLPIHSVQGDGLDSPFAGQDVTTTGIVTGRKSNGFFIQTPDADADGDANTSQALFVFTAAAPAIVVGDLVTVKGTAAEFFSLTQIESTLPGDVTVAASANPLPAPVVLTPTILDPNCDVTQLERFEGMRLHASALTSVAPTNEFGEIYAVLNGVPRPLREPGIERGAVRPPDPETGLPDCCLDVWDLNPERLVIDTDGLFGSVPLHVTSKVTLSGVTGPLDFSFGAYKLLPESAPIASSNMTAVAVPTPAANEFTVAGYNIENFVGGDIQRRKAALHIRTVMRYPDVIGVIEIGSKAALQSLAEQVNTDAVAAGDSDPQYAAELIPFGGGTQHVGFLVKTARVLINSVTQERADDTYINPTTGLPEILHDRPPLVLDAVVDPGGTNPGRIIVVVSHLRSFIDIEVVGAEGARVRAKRKAQAEATAELLQELQQANVNVPVISVGDYNAYQFSDGYTDPLSVLKGLPTAGDRIVVAESPDLVNPDFFNLTESLPVAERYSFIFEGTPQALDHVLVNGVALSYLQRYAIARSNADFPGHASAGLSGDAGRPEAHSDHDSPVAYFAFPGTPVIALNGSTTRMVGVLASFVDPGATAHDDKGPLPVSVSGSVDVNVPGSYTVSYTADNAYGTTTVTRTVIVSDTIAPSITGFFVTPDAYQARNHKMFDVSVFYTATDASRTSTCSLAVASNETVNGAGDGNTSSDWQITSAHSVQLRAERSGRGSGRIYTVTVTCVDPSGNSSTTSGTVTIAK